MEELTRCKKCFHYKACCDMDLTDSIGHDDSENQDCDNFVDASRVIVHEEKKEAKWIVEVKDYRKAIVNNDHIFVRCVCPFCNDCGYIERYSGEEWDEYYRDHYIPKIKVSPFCKQCGTKLELDI